MPVLKKDPAYDFDAEWYLVAPSQVPPGEYPNAPMPKELEEHEIEDLLARLRRRRPRRAIAAGLDGVEFHMSHGYLPVAVPLAALQPPHRWLGRLVREPPALPARGAAARSATAIGDEPFLGYRINSTSFWPGDLEMDDVKRIVARSRGAGRRRLRQPLGGRPPLVHPHADDLRAGLGARLHEGGQGGLGEARPARRADHASRRSPRRSSRRARPTRSCSRASTSPTPSGRRRRAEGRADDIRRCVAANYCWRSVIRGGRVQCVYNPEVGSRAAVGSRHARAGRGAEEGRSSSAPARPGLEYARVAAARGHDVVVLEREAEVGRPRRARSRCCPGRKEYGQIGRWLQRQAEGNGALMRTGEEIDDGLARRAAGGRAARPRRRRDRLHLPQRRLAGPDRPTAARLGDAATASPGTRCVTGQASPSGSVLVLDDLQDALAPLTAVKLAQAGCTVRLVTRWPMIGMETIPEVYYLWIRQQLYRDRTSRSSPTIFVKEIRGAAVDLLNVYAPDRVTAVDADWIVMVTGRQSENGLYHALRERGVSVRDDRRRGRPARHLRGRLRGPPPGAKALTGDQACACSKSSSQRSSRAWSSLRSRR